MITINIGVGGAFATINEGLQSIDGPPLADDYTLDVISNVVETPLVGPTPSPTMGGRTIRITCSYNEARKDDWQNLYTVSVTAKASMIQAVISDMSGAVFVDNLYLIYTGPDVFGLHAALFFFFTTVIIRDVIIDGRGNLHAGIISRATGVTPFSLYSSKIWDCQNVIYVAVESTGLCTIENSVFRSGFAGYGPGEGVCTMRSTTTLRNVAATHSAGARCYGTSVDNPHIEMYNCGASDASITTVADVMVDCEENVVAANEYQSLNDLNAKFLYPKDATFAADFVGVPTVGPAPLDVEFTDLSDYDPGSQVLVQGGMLPTVAVDDLEGIAYPGPTGYYPIGCHVGQVA